MTALTLHLGAHKTATTWLQGRLAAGRAALAERGIGYAPLEEIRQAFTVRFTSFFFQRTAEAKARAAGALGQRLAKGQDRFICSDENLVGDCVNIVRSGRLYGQFPEKVAALAEVLPEPPARVVFVVRDYAGFFASAYGEALHHAPSFLPVEQFRRRLKLDDGLWLRLVEAMAGSFGAERVRVLRFEQLDAKLPALLEALCGRPIDPALLPDRVDRRQGLSARAVEELHRLARESGPESTREALPAIAERFPRGPDFPGFDPWTAEQRARMDALYATHMDAIAQRWPGMLL